VQLAWCLCLVLSDYVRLLDLNGRVKIARRHHSVVDMQFEFRIEALGNISRRNVVFPVIYNVHL